MEGIVIDTNVFVAAAFNPRSASARVLAAVRQGCFQLIWNKPTQRETEMILRRIPRLDWERVAILFQPEGSLPAPSILRPSSSSGIGNRLVGKHCRLYRQSKGRRRLSSFRVYLRRPAAGYGFLVNLKEEVPSPKPR